MGKNHKSLAGSDGQVRGVEITPDASPRNQARGSQKVSLPDAEHSSEPVSKNDNLAFRQHRELDLFLSISTLLQENLPEFSLIFHPVQHITIRIENRKTKKTDEQQMQYILAEIQHSVQNFVWILEVAPIKNSSFLN